MRVKEHKSGWYVVMDKVRGLWLVMLRDSSGEVRDKVRCDDYRAAMDYWRAFNAIAKAA